MLERNPAKRATAQAILQHPWMKEQGVASDKPLDNVILTRLNEFATMNKLKKEAMKIIASCMPADEIAGLKAIFESIDDDKSGTITAKELHDALLKKGTAIKPEDVESLLALIDVDANGTIEYEGRDITSVPSYKRVPMGIALTPEGRRIFPSLTVEENLKVGAHSRREGPWNLESVYAAFPLVADRRDRVGVNLSGGEQQAAAIGRALMSNPRLLMLDEVSLGLAPVVVEQIYAAMPTITGNGTTVLLVEQDVNQALKVADRVQCLLEGRTVLEGAAGSLSRDDIASAYFGI
jgi:branched-chain amino acid transport system ATP-binding protein